MKTLTDIPAAARVALVRADLNVPMQDGEITDTTRIARLIPTLKALLARGLQVRVISHLGRLDPTEDKTLWDPAFSLRPVAAALESLMGQRVEFYPDCLGQTPTSPLSLLENLRYYPGEEANDLTFARALAAGADVYVNDAFSCSHRAHASIVAITQVLPAYAGLGLEEELQHLSAALQTPARPVVALVGGAKVSTKLALLENLAPKVDHLVIAGAMANTFLKAQGLSVGCSRVEEGLIPTAKRILQTYRDKIILPLDRIDGLDGCVRTVDAALPQTDYVDIGPQTVAHIHTLLAKARTVVWNGPLGLFEVKPYDSGTNAIAQSIAALTQAGQLVSVAGGGDTVAALANAGVEGKLTFVSTAGGAFLEWLEGRELPGITALG